MRKPIITIPEIAKKAVKILLVEDNLADVRLMENLLEMCRFPVKVKIAWDGEEALSFLNHSPFDGNEDPDLILLDLNLPKVDGHAVLAKIKADPHIRHIPVLILSSSNDRGDIALAQVNHANGYLIKPMGIEEFGSLVKRIEDFWFTFNDEKI